MQGGVTIKFVPPLESVPNGYEIFTNKHILFQVKLPDSSVYDISEWEILEFSPETLKMKVNFDGIDLPSINDRERAGNL